MEWKLAFFISFIVISQAASADIFINEVMYAPSSDWGGQYNEWIEIYNSGTEDANITNWLIDGKSIPDASVPAGGFVVLAKNSTKFGQFYDVPSFHVPFTLSNDGEIINISANGEVVDILDYAAYATANLAKNNNRTLEKNASQWLESAAIGGTPGAANSAAVPQNNSQENNTQTESPPENQEPEPQIQQPENSNTPRIEIIRAPESMKFGDFAGIHARFYPESRNFSKMRFVAYVFSPSWIARDLIREKTTLRNSPYNSAAAVEISGVFENATENILLPLFLKCKGDYAEGSYTARVRAYYENSGAWSDVAGSDVQISVSGENGMCDVEKCENKTVYVNKTTTVKEKCDSDSGAAYLQNNENEGTLKINITAQEFVFDGNNLTTIVFLKNSGNATLDLEVYSYLYEHSSVMSQGWSGEKWGNARTANSKKASLASGNSTTIELVNLPRENITLEKYTFKVRIDDLNNVKKSEERVFLVDVKAPEKVERGNLNVEIENASSDDRITGALMAQNTGAEVQESLWRKIMRAIKGLFNKDD